MFIIVYSVCATNVGSPVMRTCNTIERTKESKEQTQTCLSKIYFVRYLDKRSKRHFESLIHNELIHTVKNPKILSVTFDNLQTITKHSANVYNSMSS